MVNLVPWRKKNSVKIQNGNGGLSRNRHQDDFHPMARFRQEFDQLWDRFWDDWGGTSLTTGSHYSGWKLDLEENEREYIVNAELPGFEPDEIDVSLSGNVMTVRAEHSEEEKKNKNGSSYRYGSFYESFTLPCDIESDKIDAKYHNGVLNVHLPKSEDCKAKKIAVKSA